jgi:phosphoglycerol transferase MdoB-like AlkP superfamily enzyme
VLVLLESWGLALDEGFAQGIAAPYDDPGIAARYRVSRGQTPFEGSTVAAGARELCHSRMGFGILRIEPAQAAHCLPAWFHARGYEDLSVHGYSGRMFQRERWHRAIGFDRSWFGEELSADGLPECGGAFPGICDAALGEWMGRAVLLRDAGRPRFVYWVTLNSHLPVPSQVDLPPSDICAQTGRSAPLCSWARLVLEAHRAVARLGLEVTRPTVFLVVGDHAPPFADAGLRRRFSATQVPWVLLEPKSAGYSALSTTMVSSSK